jgi:hypothetical protein
MKEPTACLPLTRHGQHIKHVQEFYCSMCITCAVTFYQAVACNGNGIQILLHKLIEDCITDALDTTIKRRDIHSKLLIF